MFKDLRKGAPKIGIGFDGTQSAASASENPWKKCMRSSILTHPPRRQGDIYGNRRLVDMLAAVGAGFDMFDVSCRPETRGMAPVYQHRENEHQAEESKSDAAS
jgi:hypothetical protein